MAEAPWKLRERIVRLLEAALDPSARVVHNEKLHDVVTGNPRQFDVVIRTGPQHRETVTVVEVQKRGRRIGSEHIEAWVEKMRSVGAHRLICVTTKAFTRPALESISKRHGATVLPLTLREMERKSWPFMVVGGDLQLRVPHYTFQSRSEFLLYRTAETPDGVDFLELQTKLNDRILVRKGRDISLAELMSEELSKRGAIDGLPLGKSEVKIKLSTGPRALALLHEGRQWPVEVLEVVLDFDVQEAALPLTMSSYAPADGAPIAFAVVAQGEVHGLDVCIRMAYRATEGGLVLGRVEWSGALPKGVLHIDDVSVEEVRPGD